MSYQAHAMLAYGVILGGKLPSFPSHRKWGPPPPPGMPEGDPFAPDESGVCLESFGSGGNPDHAVVIQSTVLCTEPQQYKRLAHPKLIVDPLWDVALQAFVDRWLLRPLVVTPEPGYFLLPWYG